MTESKQAKLRTFYSIVATQTLSIIGSRLSGLAISFYIFAQTGEVTPLILVNFFAILPMVLGSSISGVLADRWDRRKVMIVADAGQAVGTFLLLLSFVSGSFELWHLYVVVFIQQIFSVFQGPAFSASITMLIPDDQRDRANAITQLSGPAAGIIAPIIAGLIYAAVGVIGAIVIDLLTFLVAMLAIVAARIPKPTASEEGRKADANIWRSMTVGFRFLWQRKPMLTLVSLFALVNFCIGGAMAMAMAYLLSRTGSEATAGTIMGVSSVGALLGGIVMGTWGGTRPRIHTIMPSLLIAGLALSAFGLSQSALMLGVSVFVMMLPIAFINASVMSIMQAKTPPDLQGRVFATLGQISLLLLPIAYLTFGALADQVLEPAVGTAAWEPLAGLLGTGKGSGMGLIYLLAGAVMFISSALVYAIPKMRTMEADMPDYVAKPGDSVEQDEHAPVPSGELAPALVD